MSTESTAIGQYSKRAQAELRQAAISAGAPLSKNSDNKAKKQETRNQSIEKGAPLAVTKITSYHLSLKVVRRRLLDIDSDAKIEVINDRYIFKTYRELTEIELAEIQRLRGDERDEEMW